MKGRKKSSADMLQRKRQVLTLGPTNSLHLKHAKCGDTTTLQWLEVSCQCESHFWYTLDIGFAYIQHAVEKYTDGIFTGEERKGKLTPYKIPEKKSLLKKLIEPFPAVESHHCRKEADKQKRQQQKKTHLESSLFFS